MELCVVCNRSRKNAHWERCAKHMKRDMKSSAHTPVQTYTHTIQSSSVSMLDRDNMLDSDWYDFSKAQRICVWQQLVYNVWQSNNNDNGNSDSRGR